MTCHVSLMARVLLKSQIISQTTLTFDEDHKHFFFIIEYDKNLLTELKCYNKSNQHYNICFYFDLFTDRRFVWYK